MGKRTCFILSFGLLFCFAIALSFSDSPVAAQSSGDTLPTRTATPPPLTTPTPTMTTVPNVVWIGQLVSNTLGVTEGQGSIFRVIVQGVKDTPIQIQSGNQVITARSGSKSEYGPYTAEFAPVTKGVWTVSVPAFGVSLNVEADNYNLAVIEFTQVPTSQATQVVQPTPTATPLGAIEWQGQIISQVAGQGVPYARLLVRVAGRDGQPVQISTLTQVLNTALTGQKPAELGPNMVEFTGLTPGKYIIDLPGLNARQELDLSQNSDTVVEFTPRQPTPIPTLTNSPTLTPLPTATFIPFPSPRLRVRPRHHQQQAPSPAPRRLPNGWALLNPGKIKAVA